MNQEQVLELAREVGAGEPESLYGRTDYVVMTKHELERFAALVAAASNKRKPLTDEKIGVALGFGEYTTASTKATLLNISRSIERAHGIVGKE